MPSYNRGNRRNRKRKESYGIYIHKILKEVHPHMSISKKAMSIMESFEQDILERIASEASQLVKHANQKTITTLEIQTAVLMLMPGDLGKFALRDGYRILQKYNASRRCK
ncbi:late histone H2B.L4-like [Ctenocephalides felis]|uniref:late histone H2B.L4-like n=1 Tax=Ctenocephalides felis TaxID=7515 RepID=UPI000E6E59C5|nr:late histone H2B.L4-like [Ctenocephalides felis]XP_026480271.1 late histone H2B.L4-like [Ctenocephalides felis]